MLFLLTVMLLVTACGPGEKKSKTGGKENENVAFPVETANDAPAVKDAFLKVAIVKDSPLVGLLNDALYSDGYDGILIDNFLGAGIFETDENFEVTDGGIATLTVDAPNKKVTIKIKDGMKWSDGQPLVADDIIYAYEIVGNKDYTGIRYTDDNEKIIGMKEYHEGKASSISGIKKVDNSTVEISFSEIGQGVYTIGNGLIGYALPKHYLKDIPIKDLETSDKVRQKIVTTGPYTIEKTVHGESLELKANPYFYKGKPKTEKVTVEIVNSQTIVSALKAGKYDIAYQIPTDLYKTFKDLDNLQILGRQELYYSYMGFKVGRFDKTKGENIVNPNAKMADPALRKAMAHAIDNDMLGKEFYHGLRFRALSPIAAPFKTLLDPNINGTPYDLELAKKLLDDAGYKDTNGDGIRENKDGSELTINYAGMSGSEVAEPIAQYYLQQWKSIGLNVELVDGRLLDFNNFYDRIQSDDPAIDVYSAAFGQASDPNPVGIFGKSAAFNFTRYTSPELQTIIDKLGSLKL